MTMETLQLDWRGMRCPEPILKTAREVRSLKKSEQGGLVLVLADDDAFPVDIAQWCRSSGVTLEGVLEQDGGYQATLRVGPSAPEARSSAPTPAATPTPAAAPAPRVETLDCRGMRCPEPIMKAARAVRRLEPGVMLDVLADDDAFEQDIMAWSARGKAHLVEVVEQDGAWRARLSLEPAAEAAAPEPTPEPAPKPAPRRAQPAPQAPARAAAPDAGAGSFALSLELDGVAPEHHEARVRALMGPEWTGEQMRVRSSDPGALQRVLGVVTGAGHELARFDAGAGELVFVVSGDADAHASPSQALVPAARPLPERAEFLVIHNDFESLMAAMMVANTSAAQGLETSVFFSFWGVNLLRGDRPRPDAPKPKLTIIHRLFRWMMPKGPSRQPLSKMHFGGAGKAMMLSSMRSQNVMSLEQLVDAAVEAGVKFKVCTMSMNIMGIHKQDIVDLPNVEFAGVASFVGGASTADVSMVF